MTKAADVDALLARANPYPDETSVPAPGATRQERLERVMQIADQIDPAPGTRRRRRVWRTTGAIALVGALATVGISAGVLHWTADDIPPQGQGPYAFSAAVVDHLPQGYNRVRPARIEELPERPAILFPKGVTYAQAVARYLEARQSHRVLPHGVQLVAPLPAGISVRVRDDGRVMLDPAAPVGWDLKSHLVGSLFIADPGAAPTTLTIPRCQVLLPSDPPDSPAACIAGPTAPLITERAGRWTAAGPMGHVLPTRLVGSTDLTVLERPRTRNDDLSPGLERRLREAWDRPGVGHRSLDYSNARLAADVAGRRIYVIPSTDGETVCIHIEGRGADVSGTCNPRSVLVTFGAIPLVGQRTYAGLVGDGYDTVTVPGMGKFPIHGNVFSVPLPPGPVAAITLSGPVGVHRLSTFGHR